MTAEERIEKRAKEMAEYAYEIQIRDESWDNIRDYWCRIARLTFKYEYDVLIDAIGTDDIMAEYAALLPQE